MRVISSFRLSSAILILPFACTFPLYYTHSLPLAPLSSAMDARLQAPNACPPPICSLSKTYLGTGHKGLAAPDEEEDDEERAGQRELHVGCLLVCGAAWRWAGVESGEGRWQQLICDVVVVWKGIKGIRAGCLLSRNRCGIISSRLQTRCLCQWLRVPEVCSRHPKRSFVAARSIISRRSHQPLLPLLRVPHAHSKPAHFTHRTQGKP